MRTIKLDFVGFWQNFDKNNNFFTDILRERYHVEITDQPDFVIASVLGAPYEYTKYDCVRILFTGEPLAPDFNVFDYAITFEQLTCLDADGNDRHFRYPLCLVSNGRIKEMHMGMTYEAAEKELAQKKYFCNFLYGHRSAYGERERILEVLQKYKRVEAAGSFMNNMPDHRVIPYSKEKYEFQRQCKFTIAFESISHPGFITEKIVDPICSCSVPIYYGNPLCHKEFNSKALINCHEFGSFEEAAERVIEIDNNDELYIQMLMEHKFVTATYLEEMTNSFKAFLWRIFSTEKEEAYRRLRHYVSKFHDDNLRNFNRFSSSKLYRLQQKLSKFQK